MRKLALAAGVATLAAVFASPANAVLQIAISDGTNVFTCSDGAACDFGGQANDLLTLNTNVGMFNIRGTLSTAVQSNTLGNTLDLSTFTITNTGRQAGVLTLVVSQTDYQGPVASINESGSLTFHDNVGAGLSTLSFFADANNGQGAGATLATPGTNLFNTSGTATQNPTAFSGNNTSIFLDRNLFSMTERAQLALIGGGSVTGFDLSMQTPVPTPTGAIPEPSTWAMMILGFLGVGTVAMRRQRKDRLLRLA